MISIVIEILCIGTNANTSIFIHIIFQNIENVISKQNTYNTYIMSFKTLYF